MHQMNPFRRVEYTRATSQALHAILGLSLDVRSSGYVGQASNRRNTKPHGSVSTIKMRSFSSTRSINFN